MSLWLGVALLLWIIVWVGTCGLYGCPSRAEIQTFRPSEGSRVVDREGTPIGRLTSVRRMNVPLSSVPRSVRAAFIATEDRRFYYHRGIDWRSAGRALVRNASQVRVREGFSTITMQVARNAFLPISRASAASAVSWSSWSWHGAWSIPSPSNKSSRCT